MWHNRRFAVPDLSPDNAVAQELDALRAEVELLRTALAEARRSARQQPAARMLMATDGDLPGVFALWRGERGLAWQLFVQAAVTINVVLAVVAVITIASS
jgi:hypothetical protein